MHHLRISILLTIILKISTGAQQMQVGSQDIHTVSYTHLVLLVSQKVFFILQGDIWYMHRLRISILLTIILGMSIGAQQMLAGSQDTLIQSMDH